MSTFITTTDIGAGARVAIKDVIDLAGVPTTAGCRAKAAVATAAPADAACLGEIRRQVTAGKVRLVGKTNLNELAFGTSGRNPWFGMPRNPLDGGRIPGGSSSGSAVAVATGEADIALGTDTGGSVRIPAACCAVAGLKTSWGRIPVGGTWPLAPALDTIGPLARDVAGLVGGMRLLDPTFVPAEVDPDELRILRLAVPAHPDVDSAIAAALAALGLPVSSIRLPGWQQAWHDASTIVATEAWRSNNELFERDPSGVGRGVATRLRAGSRITDAAERSARTGAIAWRQALDRVLTSTTVIVLPTLRDFPPPIDTRSFDGTELTMPVNLAGLPALTMPVPTRGPIPAAMQIIGVDKSEELLVAVARMIERALS